MDEFTGEFAQAVREIEDLYRQNRSSYADFDAFDKEIAKAAALGDVHHDPVVAKAAQILRKRVWDKVLDRHVENGNWNREDMVPRNAHSYFPLVNDAEAIRARKEEYIDYYTNGFKRQLDEEFAAASRARDARQSDIEDARIALKGVRVRVPDGFGPNGKPRFKTEVRAKGKIGELLDTIKAEHEENIRAIRTSKDQERAQLEAEVKAERDILRAELEEELDRLKAERDAELEKLRETFEEMTRGSVVGTDAEGKPVRAGAELNRDQLKRARAELMPHSPRWHSSTREPFAPQRGSTLPSSGLSQRRPRRIERRSRTSTPASRLKPVPPATRPYRKLRLRSTPLLLPCAPKTPALIRECSGSGRMRTAGARPRVLQRTAIRRSRATGASCWSTRLISASRVT